MIPSVTPSAPRPTFRDPAGSLSLEARHAVRTIHADARAGVLEFLQSDFCRRIDARGDMVGTAIIESGGGLRLLHPRIAIPTYPWEWTPSQWLAAAELTLGLGEEAVDEGWILKDATPLNVLFIGPRPVLVDVLSFERRDPHSPVWLAYAQYVRTFLLPLLAHRLLGWPLEASLLRRDGYEPAEVYACLSWPQRLSRSALWPVTLATWLEKRSGRSQGNPAKAARPSRRRGDPELATHILRKNLRDLRRRTRRSVAGGAASEWSEYTGTLKHYTAAEAEAKRRWVERALAQVQPARVLDVGANTGEYSVLAAERGSEVVALERDAAAAERLYAMSLAKGAAGERIQTIHADFARPTPAAGWENSESLALLDRLQGQFDLVMMLAVIHHLVLLEQIPLPAIVLLAARLTRKHLIVEWVPAEDPMFQSLMRGRDSLYGSLCEADLLAACSGVFTMVERQPLGNGRVLFLLAKI